RHYPLAIGEREMYVALDERIVAVPLEGGPLRELRRHAPRHAPFTIACSRGYVWFGDFEGLGRIPLGASIARVAAPRLVWADRPGAAWIHAHDEDGTFTVEIARRADRSRWIETLRGDARHVLASLPDEKIAAATAALVAGGLLVLKL